MSTENLHPAQLRVPLGPQLCVPCHGGLEAQPNDSATYARANSEEKPEDLPSGVFSAGFLMVHDAVRRRQNQVAELARRQQVRAVLLNISHCHIVPEDKPQINHALSLRCGFLFSMKAVRTAAKSNTTRHA